MAQSKTISSHLAPSPILTAMSYPPPSHAFLHWSACVNDACSWHLSSKIDTGYWPKAYKPPKFLRQEVPLSENKENIPPDDAQADSQHDLNQKEKHDAAGMQH